MTGEIKREVKKESSRPIWELLYAICMHCYIGNEIHFKTNDGEKSYITNENKMNELKDFFNIPSFYLLIYPTCWVSKSQKNIYEIRIPSNTTLFRCCILQIFFIKYRNFYNQHKSMENLWIQKTMLIHKILWYMDS